MYLHGHSAQLGNKHPPRGGLNSIALDASDMLVYNPHAEFLEPTEQLENNRKRIPALRAAIAELENTRKVRRAITAAKACRGRPKRRSSLDCPLDPRIDRLLRTARCARIRALTPPNVPQSQRQR